MSENKIKVSASTTSKAVRVNVSTPTLQGTVALSQDTSAYNAKIAEQWAVSENLVLGQDYSSKYYANKAKESASNAQGSESAIRDLYNGFLGETTEAIENVQGARDEAIANIETSRVEAVDSINSTKTTILSDIEFVADGEKKEIQDLADEIKDSGDTVNTAIEAGVERLNSIDALKKSQITNCILEIPQRIKYTFNNGTFTLLAGSVVIFPHGTTDLSSSYPIGSNYYNSNFKVVDRQYANGLFFVWAEMQADKTISQTGTVSGASNILYINAEKNTFGFNSTNLVSSGTTKPTGGQIWYDTTNNIFYNSSDSFDTYAQIKISFPICNFTRESGVITNIDQVFNGFGYIGNTIFCDKGVKGLIPDGRNADGSLKNIEFTTSNVFTQTRNMAGINKPLVLRGNNFSNYAVANYNEELNLNISSAGTNVAGAIVGTWSADSTGKITSFEPKQPFRAVDYNDYISTPHITETYVNGTSGYRIWSDKYCEQWGYGAGGSTTLAITLLKPYANTNYSIVTTLQRDTASQIYETYVTSIKTTGFDIISNASGATNANKFWRACGYID